MTPPRPRPSPRPSPRPRRSLPRSLPPNGPAVAALVCGLAGFWILWVVLSPLAILLGLLGWHRARGGARYLAMSKVGVVLGVLGIALYLALWPSLLRGTAYFS